MEGLKKRLLLAGLLGGLAVSVHAESPQETFKQANVAYGNGQFSQAASLYETARAQGLNHWILYYNLGNAYFKSGETGKAIASYLRAFRINSHQGDVIYNLNLALTKVGEPLLPNEALAVLFWRLFFILSINTLALLSSALFVVVCIGGALFFLGRWRPGADGVIGVLLALLAIGLWFGLRVSIAERHDGIVISGTAEVRSGPALSYTANFTVPEGRRVLILDEQEPVKGWLEIGVPQEGLKGWVPDSSVEPV